MGNTRHKGNLKVTGDLTVDGSIPALLAYLASVAATEVTIATNAITPTTQHHTVDTEADAATGNLTTINTLTGFLMLRLENAARVVTLVHGTSANQIACPADTNVEMQANVEYLLARATASDPWRIVGGAGGGGSADMEAATYDPLGVAGDAFDMANMAEAADAKVLTAAERTKIGHISVTQAVDLDQMETDIAALANGMVYKGDWDASAGTFPGAGAAQTGWFYYVSVGGTVDSVMFTVGDNIVATTDNASAATYAANWSKHDQTDAVQAVAGETGSISKSALLAAINVADGAEVNPDKMPLAEAQAGNATTKRTVDAATLKAAVLAHETGGGGGDQIDLSALTIAELGRLAEYLAVQDWALTPPTITNGVYAKFENNMTDEAGRQTMTPSGGAYAADWAVGGYSRRGGSVNFSGNTDDFVFDGDFCLAFVAKGAEGEYINLDFIDEYWTAPWSFYLYWEDTGYEMPAYIMWGPGGFYYAELADLGTDPVRIEVSRSGSTVKLWVNGGLAASETDGTTWGAGGGVDMFDAMLSSGLYLDEFVVNKGTAWHTAAYDGYTLQKSVVIGSTKLDDAGTTTDDLWSADKIAAGLADKLDIADVIVDADYYEPGQVLAIETALDRALGFPISELVEDTDEDKIIATKAEYHAELVLDSGVAHFLEWGSLYMGGGRLRTTWEARQGTVTTGLTFANRNCTRVVGVSGSNDYRGGIWWTGSTGPGYESVVPRSAAFAGNTYGDDFSVSMAIHRNNESPEPYLIYVQDGVEVLRLRWLNSSTVRLDFMGTDYNWTGLTQAADAWQWILVERHDGVLRLAVDGTRHATTHTGVTTGVSSYPASTAAQGNTYLTDSALCTGVAYTVGVNTTTSYVANLCICTSTLRDLHDNATVEEGTVERRVLTTPRRAKYAPAYAADSGSADAMAVTVGDTAYYAGQTLMVLVAANNTGATTIDVDSLGTKSVVDGVGGALSGGELVAGNVVMLVYNGTNFNLIGV